MKKSPLTPAPLTLGLAAALFTSLVPALQAQYGTGAAYDSEFDSEYDVNPEVAPNEDPSRIAFRDTLEGPNRIGAVRFSPDGETLVALGASLSAFSWPDREERYTAPTRNEIDRNGVAAEFSADGSRLALGGTGDDRVLVLDAATGEFADRFNTGHTGVYGLAWANQLGVVSLHGDGAIVLSRFGSEDETPSGNFAALRDLAGSLRPSDDRTQVIAQLPHETESSLSWSGSGNGLMAGTTDSDAPAQYIPLTGQSVGETQAIPVNHDAAVDVLIPLSPRHYASGDRDGMLSIWRGASPDDALYEADLSAPINSLRRSPNGRWLAIGYGDTGFAILDMVTGELEEQETPEGSSGVSSLDFSPDSRILAIGSFSGEIHVYDVIPPTTNGRAD